METAPRSGPARARAPLSREPRQFRDNVSPPVGLYVSIFIFWSCRPAAEERLVSFGPRGSLKQRATLSLPVEEPQGLVSAALNFLRHRRHLVRPLLVMRRLRFTSRELLS